MKDEDFSDYQQSAITITQYLRCTAGAEYMHNYHTCTLTHTPVPTTPRKGISPIHHEEMSN